MSCTQACLWIALVICIELFLSQVVNSKSTCGQLTSTHTHVKWSCTISPPIPVDQERVQCRYRYKKEDEEYKNVSSGNVKFGTNDDDDDDGFVRLCAMELPIVDLSPGSYTFEVDIFNPQPDKQSRNLLIINGAAGTASDCSSHDVTIIILTVLFTVAVLTLLVVAAVFYVRKRKKRSRSNQSNACQVLNPTSTHQSPPGSSQTQAPSTDLSPAVSLRPSASPNRGIRANQNIYHCHIPPRLAAATQQSADSIITPEPITLSRVSGSSFENFTSPEIMLIPVGINRKSNSSINNNSINNSNDGTNISSQVHKTKDTGQTQSPIYRATHNQNLLAKLASDCQDAKTKSEIEHTSECEDVETPPEHEDVESTSERQDIKPTSKCEPAKSSSECEDFEQTSECSGVETPIKLEDVEPPSECNDARTLSKREHGKPKSKREDIQASSPTPLADAHPTTGATSDFKPNDSPTEILPTPRKRSKKDDYMDFDPYLGTSTSSSSSSSNATYKNNSLGNYYNVEIETQSMDQPDEGVEVIAIPRKENWTKKRSIYEDPGPLFLDNRVIEENRRDKSSEAAKRRTTLPQHSNYMNVCPEDWACHRSSV